MRVTANQRMQFTVPQLSGAPRAVAAMGAVFLINAACLAGRRPRPAQPRGALT